MWAENTIWYYSQRQRRLKIQFGNNQKQRRLKIKFSNKTLTFTYEITNNHMNQIYYRFT